MKQYHDCTADMKVTVDLKNEEIKTLKDKIDKLESEKKALEVELEAVRKEVVELKEANKSLSKKMEGMSKKIETLEDAMQRKTSTEAPSLVLGELCTQIQAMMYQKVHPSLYDEETSYTVYKVKHIEEIEIEIEDMNDIKDEQRKGEAKQRWDELKKKLKWVVRAMKSLQMSRNVTAHPKLNEELIVFSAEMMKKEGKLPACIEEFITMWKTLQSGHV